MERRRGLNTWRVLVVGVALGALATLIIMRFGGARAVSPDVELTRIQRTDDPIGGKHGTSLRMPQETQDAIHSAIQEEIAAIDALPGASSAINAAAEYFALIADNSPDNAFALAYEVGAKPDPELLARSRAQLAAIPDRVKPANAQAFTDLQVIRWWYASVVPARWNQVSPETLHATYLPKSQVNPELDALFHMNPPDGFVHSTFAQFLFPLPNLLQRVRTAQTDALMLAVEVAIERGDRQRVTLLLGEYEPGKWYPVAHRTDFRTKVQPFAADRAPRPN